MILGDSLSGLGPTVRGGTVLFSRSNTAELVGACAYVEQDYPDLHLPDLIWELSPDRSRFDAKWLHYALASPLCRSQINRKATGTSGTMKKLSMSSLRQISLLVPPLAEQKAIAHVLSAWDRANRQVKDLIYATTRLKYGLMQRLLTGESQLPNLLNGTWKTFRLGEIFDERNETNVGGLPLLSITVDRGVIPRDSMDRKDTSSANKSLYKRIVPGDIGYNTMRMWQGVSAVSSLEGIISPAYTVCVPRACIDPCFAGYLFKYPPMIHQFFRYSQGLVNDTLSLKFQHFAQIKSSIPPLAVQQEIVRVLRTLDHRITLLAKKRKALEKQQQGMTERVLAGEVRVTRFER